MTPTLFSVSYAGLWGQHRLSLEAFIRKAADLGYSAVELMGKRPHLSILDATDAFVGKIRDCAASCGVEVATLASYTDFTAGKTAAEVPFGEMQVAYVRELAKIGQKLGAKIIRVFTGYTTAAEAWNEDWEKCVKTIRECAVVAEGYGLAIGVQNHHDTGISCDAYIEFLNDVDHPNCRAMFDPWVPALHGDDMYHYARALARRMVQTTIADYVRLKRFAYMPGLVNYKPLPEMVRAVPVGEGFLDLPSFFKGLKDGGFDGYVAYEMCSPLRGGGSEENLDRTAKLSLERIKGLIEAD
jgi:sugar phosphate isomerase/epimerase